MTKANFSKNLNEDDFNWKMTSNGRLPQLLKLEYLCNYWSDLSQILSLGFYDQSKPFKCFNLRRLQMEMTSNGRLPQLLVVEYLCNYWSDLSQNLNLGFYDHGKPFKGFK